MACGFISGTREVATNHAKQATVIDVDPWLTNPLPFIRCRVRRDVDLKVLQNRGFMLNLGSSCDVFEVVGPAALTLHSFCLFTSLSHQKHCSFNPKTVC